MPEKIFCLILNFNHPRDTVNCALSLLKSDLPDGSEILIIDNGKENLGQYFAGKLPGTAYLKSPGNIGFAAGNNQGIKLATTRGATHILIVNPDVTVPSRFFHRLLSTFAAHSSAGIVAPAHTEGKGIYGLGGRIDWRTCSFPHDNMRKLPAKPLPYELVTFACVLVKTEVFRVAGLMDERYFMYLEDVDFCVTAHKAGFEIWLDPAITVRHRTSSSFTDPRRKIIYSLVSCLRFIAKYYRFPRYILPFLHAIYFYPKEYLYWTIKNWKSSILKPYAP